VRRAPDAQALSDLSGRVELTWAEYARRVGALAAGLVSLGAPGRTVALLCGNRPEWQLVDLAALFAGATPFSLYATATADQIEDLLRDADAHVLIADGELLDKVRSLGDVAHVVALDERPDVMTLSELERLAPPIDVLTAPDPVSESDTATLIYTSGTTGRPKGVELSHANVLFVAAALRDAVGLAAGRLVSYLPHAHIVDRLASHYLPILTGSSVVGVPTARAVFEALPRIRPTIFNSVPRLWEALRDKLDEHITSDAALAAALERGLDRVRRRDSAVPSARAPSSALPCSSLRGSVAMAMANR
jgi:long-chain acyl-CoA synthetase